MKIKDGGVKMKKASILIMSILVLLTSAIYLVDGNGYPLPTIIYKLLPIVYFIMFTIATVILLIEANNLSNKIMNEEKGEDEIELIQHEGITLEKEVLEELIKNYGMNKKEIKDLSISSEFEEETLKVKLYIIPNLEASFNIKELINHLDEELKIKVKEFSDIEKLEIKYFVVKKKKAS